jgi:hypothetical protein
MMAAQYMKVKQTTTTQNPSFPQIAFNDNFQLTVIRHMEEIISYVELRKYSIPQTNTRSNERKKDKSRSNF